MTAADIAKLAVAVALVVAGSSRTTGSARSAMVLRVLAILAGLAAGAAVACSASREVISRCSRGEAVTEVKKVVWPSRKETMQTTAAVFAFVVVMAIFLWITDKTLEWVLYDLILGWKK